MRSPRFTASSSSTARDPLATVTTTAVTVRAMPTQVRVRSRSPSRTAAPRATKMGEAAPRMPALRAVVHLSPQYHVVVFSTRPVEPRIANAM